MISWSGALRTLFCCLCVSYGFLSLSQVSIYGAPESLSGQVNSAYDENTVVLHPSGKVMYFVRSNHPANTNGVLDDGDIWVSVWSEESWSAPIRVVGGVNSRSMERLVGLVDGGEAMITLDEKGTQMARFQAGRWGELSAEPIKFFKSISEYMSGSVTADGNHLLLSLESYGSHGVEDIYIAKKNPLGGWMPLINLGASINTEFQEITPFLAPDNKTLIFSSNGHQPNKGSFDLYYAVRKDDTWKNWSEPQPLQELNTDGRDYGFFTNPNSDLAYFISTRDSDGYGDIKQVSIKAIEKDSSEQQDESVQITEIEEDTLFNSYVFKCVVLEKHTSMPLVADFTFISAQDTFKHESFLDGRVDAELRRDIDYNLRIRCKGYIPIDTVVTMTERQDQVLNAFFLEKLTSGTTIRLQHVYFERGKAVLIEGSENELDDIVLLMQENAKMKIKLEGHTDNRGNQVLNLKLSQDRVDSIKDYLVSQGVKRSRIAGEGFGGTRPIASNSREETRKLNRRVEFKVLSVE